MGYEAIEAEVGWPQAERWGSWAVFLPHSGLRAGPSMQLMSEGAADE